jgi:pimeloyl-ACP methyl ester carboxylesterase
MWGSTAAPRERSGSPIEHHADMGLSGFAQGRYAIGEASYFVDQGGDGPPVVLLHGFPETHLCVA